MHWLSSSSCCPRQRGALRCHILQKGSRPLQSDKTRSRSGCRLSITVVASKHDHFQMNFNLIKEVSLCFQCSLSWVMISNGAGGPHSSDRKLSCFARSCQAVLIIQGSWQNFFPVLYFFREHLSDAPDTFIVGGDKGEVDLAVMKNCHASIIGEWFQQLQITL